MMIKNIYRKINHQVCKITNPKEEDEIKKILGHEKPIYHIHVRKTGGTTINFAFLSNAKVDNLNEFYIDLARKKNHRTISNSKVFVGWNLILLNEGNYSFGFSHRPLHELNLSDHIFKFTCLRDPVKRVVSHYKMLKYFQINNIKDPSLKIEGKWLGNSIIDFASNAPRPAIFNQLHMFSKKFEVNEAIEEVSKLDAVLFTEQLQQGLTQLEQVTDWTLPVSNQKKFANNIEIETQHLEQLRDTLDLEYKFVDAVKEHLKQKKTMKTVSTKPH